MKRFPLRILFVVALLSLFTVHFTQRITSLVHSFSIYYRAPLPPHSAARGKETKGEKGGKTSESLRAREQHLSWYPANLVFFLSYSSLHTLAAAQLAIYTQYIILIKL